MSRTSSKTRSLFILFVLTIVWALVYLLIEIKNQGNSFFLQSNKRSILNELHHNVMLEKGTGCQMPIVDPFSEVAMKFNPPYKKLECHKVDWVDCFKDECFVLDPKRVELMDITCSYRDVIYHNDSYYELAAPVKLKGNETYKLVRSDAVKISCSGRHLNGIDLLPIRWYGYKTGLRSLPERTPLRKDSQNVMIIAFDSISKAAFIRRMKKSYKLFEELGFIVLNSYNVVGDGTPAALFPLLTGKNEGEFVDVRRFGKTNNIFFNVSQFLFDKAKNMGYRTAYYEDMPWVGTFQFRFNGFSTQPADHYFRSMMMAEFKNGRKWHMGFSERNCIGGTPIHSLMLRLTQQLLQLPGKQFGLTFISSISHDDCNLVSVADDEFAEFLTWTSNADILRNTTLIVMGDHGTRYSEFRKTKQGKLEERLPLMAIRLADDFATANPEAVDALVSNVDVLTTPFDVNAMLHDLLRLPEMKSDFRIEGSDLLRAISLLTPIPKTRSCGEAGIKPHWCACSKWHEITAADKFYYRVANALLRFVNTITKEHRSLCYERHMNTIHEVQRFSLDVSIPSYKNSQNKIGFFPDLSDVLNNKPKFIHFQTTVSMTPDGATFEGTFTYNSMTDTLTVSEKDISRLDEYGNRSKCISDEYPHLSKFCFCPGDNMLFN